MRRSILGPSRLPSLLAALAALALLAGCGKSGSDKSTSSAAANAQRTPATTPATTATTTAPTGPCRKVAMPATKHLKLGKPTLKLDPGKTWTAVVTTNCGAFTIALDVKRAPKTAASFASLSQKGFYDHLTFHRIAPGFVIQGGDPLGNGTGNPGYTIVEAPPKDLQYTHGIVAMAKSATEPDGASGSQFFVVLGDNVGLPPQYALVGKVTKGLDVVDAIGSVPLETQDQQGSAPVDPVVISSVKVHGG